MADNISLELPGGVKVLNSDPLDPRFRVGTLASITNDATYYIGFSPIFNIGDSKSYKVSGGSAVAGWNFTEINNPNPNSNPNIIANKGVGTAVTKPVTGLTIGDIYVSIDSKLKFTATGATTWDAGVVLITGVFINNTLPTANLLYQYDGASVELTGDGSVTSIKIDGGRANEVYQQDDTINGGGA